MMPKGPCREERPSVIAAAIMLEKIATGEVGPRRPGAPSLPRGRFVHADV